MAGWVDPVCVLVHKCLCDSWLIDQSVLDGDCVFVSHSPGYQSATLTGSACWSLEDFGSLRPGLDCGCPWCERCRE